MSAALLAAAAVGAYFLLNKNKNSSPSGADNYFSDEGGFTPTKQSKVSKGFEIANNAISTGVTALSAYQQAKSAFEKNPSAANRSKFEKQRGNVAQGLLRKKGYGSTAKLRQLFNGAKTFGDIKKKLSGAGFSANEAELIVSFLNSKNFFGKMTASAQKTAQRQEKKTANQAQRQANKAQRQANKTAKKAAKTAKKQAKKK